MTANQSINSSSRSESETHDFGRWVEEWSNLSQNPSGFIGFDQAPTKIITSYYSLQLLLGFFFRSIRWFSYQRSTIFTELSLKLLVEQFEKRDVSLNDLLIYWSCSWEFWMIHYSLKIYYNHELSSIRLLIWSIDDR